MSWDEEAFAKTLPAFESLLSLKKSIVCGLCNCKNNFELHKTHILSSMVVTMVYGIDGRGKEHKDKQQNVLWAFWR